MPNPVPSEPAPSEPLASEPVAPSTVSSQAAQRGVTTPAVSERQTNTIPDWIALVARGALAIAIAVVITFSADHSAELGYRIFAIFAVISGIFVVLSAFRSPSSLLYRPWFAAQGLLGIAAGIVAAVSIGAGIPFLLFVVSGWAALTGAIELVTGLRARGRVSLARDWIFAGALTALFAVAVLLIPAGYSERFVGPDSVERFLTASVILVGAFGAYAAILGVFILIAAFSLRWPPTSPAVSIPTAGDSESEKLP